MNAVPKLQTPVEAPSLSPTAAVTRAAMSTAARVSVWSVYALLWLTGALWLLVHLAFPGHNEFGVLPNPWEPWLMRLHGLVAVGGVFSLGWITAAHIPARWSRGVQRVSGLWLAGLTLVLVVSGYALYYTTGGVHDGAAVLHQWLGLAAIFAGFAHGRRWRSAR